MVTPTVGGPIDQFSRGQGPQSKALDAKFRRGDVQATFLVCSEILYGMLADCDVRLERLEEYLEESRKATQ